ncbi:MAG: 23S rRNA (adenine(2503)-C(2))-methyltransferase RlmN [Flavobacteriaceae bacterium]|nr:23S rRNA (adenine(2503)-C(2))-methyltransferase RlmN [Flavobacteriaceae bacterium]
MGDSEKIDIRVLTLFQLREIFEKKGLLSYRADQVYNWIWKKGIHSFDLMTNISKESRSLLKLNFQINRIKFDISQKSIDGTIKNTVRLNDDNLVEAVLIPTMKRKTACISSQVGCSLNCEFCATSKMKNIRNLKKDEIFDQVFLMNKQSLNYYNKPLTNIVFMGMGEPLMNYKNVVSAIDKITDPSYLGFSKNRITISTSGIPKFIKKLADDNIKVELAISLHSARDRVREKIMPFTKKISIETLKESLVYWQNKNKKILTLEYIVWNSINDLKEDVNALIEFCKGLLVKVNLIEYNPIGDPLYKNANNSVIELYKKELRKNKITITIRKSRGKDIDAACGQLANKSKKFLNLT